jgi:hypothetical protein
MSLILSLLFGENAVPFQEYNRYISILIFCSHASFKCFKVGSNVVPRHLCHHHFSLYVTNDIR